MGLGHLLACPCGLALGEDDTLFATDSFGGGVFRVERQGDFGNVRERPLGDRVTVLFSFVSATSSPRGFSPPSFPSDGPLQVHRCRPLAFSATDSGGP